MKKLFVQNEDGGFEELSAVAIGVGLKEIKKTKVIDAITKYIETCTKNKCLKNQYSEKYYFNKLNQFLTLKKINFIDEVTREHIDLFESDLLQKMKSSSVNRRFNTFKNFFSKCQSWGLIRENPCIGMKKRKEDTVQIRTWTKDVFDRFLCNTDGIYKKIFTFLWVTGCRPMELKNLKWTDIDYDEKIIIFRCGKNAQVSRTFPLIKKADAIIHSISPESIFVFTQNKKQICNDLLYHYCKKRLRAIGLNNFTVYGIRHGFGTKLANQGVSAFYIAELMGHTKLETTKKYVHSDKKQLIQILTKAN